MTKFEIKAIQNAKPQKPQVVELCGGYYYKCHWISCNEDLKKWYNYCPNCGNRIDWKGINE